MVEIDWFLYLDSGDTYPMNPMVNVFSHFEKYVPLENLTLLAELYAIGNMGTGEFMLKNNDQAKLFLKTWETCNFTELML